MSGTSEPRQSAQASADDRAVSERGGADRTQPGEVAWVDVAELRAITPEELQILAATGC